MNAPAEPESVRPNPTRRKGFWAFAALMIALAVLFAGLGKWQLDRLAWKQGLIATVAHRMNTEPGTLPPAALWPQIDFARYDYQPVKLNGRFLKDRAVLVFVSLTEAKGRYSGPGFWVMTPLALEGGGTVFVNRGFVPAQFGDKYLHDSNAPKGGADIVGIARLPEAAGWFTPGPQPDKRLDYVRDPERLARLEPADLAPFAPIYVDLPAGPPGTLPQGGETVIDFPNNHMGYAITWFGLAIVTVLMLGGWVWRQFHPEFDVTRYI